MDINNKPANTSVIAYYINQNWMWGEVQPASNEADWLFISGFER